MVPPGYGIVAPRYGVVAPGHGMEAPRYIIVVPGYMIVVVSYDMFIPRYDLVATGQDIVTPKYDNVVAPRHSVVVPRYDGVVVPGNNIVSPGPDSVVGPRYCIRLLGKCSPVVRLHIPREARRGCSGDGPHEAVRGEPQRRDAAARVVTAHTFPAAARGAGPRGTEEDAPAAAQVPGEAPQRAEVISVA